MSTITFLLILLPFHMQRISTLSPSPEVSTLSSLPEVSTLSPFNFKIAIISDGLEEIYFQNISSKYKLNAGSSSMVSQQWFTNEYELIEEYYLSENSEFRTENRLIFDLRDNFQETLCLFSYLNNVPYFTTSLEQYEGCQVINVYPTTRDYLHAALQIFEFEEKVVPQVILFTEKWLDIDPTFSRIENYSNIEVIIYNLMNNTTIKHISKLLLDKTVQRMILLESYETLNNFTKKLKIDERDTVDQLIIIPTDSIICPYFPVPYICLKNTRYDPKYKQSRIFHQEAIEHLYSTLQSWTMNNISEHCTFNTTEKKLSDEVVNELRKALQNGVKTNITIKQINKSITHNLIGSWDNIDGMKLLKKPYPTVPLAALSVTLLREPPFVNLEYTADGVRYSGYTVDVWEEIARRLNLKYIYREPADGQYGVQLPDGSWTGAVGEVATGVTDVGAGAISVTAERESVIDFSAPYFDYAGIQILMKSPENSVSLFVFTSVFSEPVWAIWFAFLFLTGFLIYLFHRWMNKTFAQNLNPKPINLFNLKDSFWFVIASIALAGPERSPVTVSSRLLVAGFWFFCELIMATYTANLAAFLTSSRLVTSIYSLEDLASQNTIKHCVIAGSSGETYFKRMSDIEDSFYSLWRDMSYATSPDSTVNKYAVWDYPLGDKYQRLWKSMKFVKNSEEGLSKVLDGNAVFFQETPVLEYDMMRHCGLTTVGKPFSAKPYAFVLPQRSPLVKQVSTVILQLQSETLLTTLKNKWWKNGTVPCSVKDEGSGLSFDTLGGIFIVMLIGVALGIVTLVIESIIAKYTNFRKRVKRKNENSGTNDDSKATKAIGEEFFDMNEKEE